MANRPGSSHSLLSHHRLRASRCLLDPQVTAGEITTFVNDAKLNIETYLGFPPLNFAIDVSGPSTTDCITTTPIQNVKTTQVIHGIVIDDGSDGCTDLPGFQATVFLPPGWDPNNPERYPIVSWSNWDLSTWVFSNGGLGETDAPEGQRMAEMISLSGLGGRTGAIGVIWNGGGHKGMFSFSETNHYQFRRLMDHLHGTYNADPDRVIVYGGSRGGMAALAMASAPDLPDVGHSCPALNTANYQVKFAAVSAAIGWFGERKRDLIFEPTYPISYRNWTDVIGFHDAWRTTDQSPDITNNWLYPTAGSICASDPFGDVPDPTLGGLEWDEASWEIFMGRSDFVAIDEDLVTAMSAGSERLLTSLINNGTEVFVEVGSHDKQPYFLKLEYARELQRVADAIAAGANLVEVDLVLAGGHSHRDSGDPVPFNVEQRSRVWDALQQWVDPLVPLGTTLEAPRIEYFHAECDTGEFSYVPITPDVIFPFTMEGPSRLWPGQQFSLVFVGENSTPFRLEILDPNQTVLYDSGVTPVERIGDDGTVKFPFDHRILRNITLNPEPTVTTELTYRLRIRRGLETLTLDTTPSANGEAPTLVFEVPTTTNVSGTQIYDDIKAMTPTCNVQQNWGIYEFGDWTSQ